MPTDAKRIAETDVLTDLNITDGTAGQVLTTNGAGSFSFQDTSSPGGSQDFIATGAITNGDIVGLRSDGTVERTVSAANAASWIGIAAENISSSTIGTVKIMGGVAEGLSGLTVGTTYYVDSNGTLTASSTVYGKIGRALSSTQLLITNSN